ncbi:MAG: ABC transporter ATP-binding protein [Caldilineaceae bacterium]
MGKSGSGKSTLLNLISGIDAPSQGDVIIVGDDGPVTLNALSDRARTIFRRNHIGIIFQFFNLIPTLTVQENVLLPLELTGARRDQRAHALALLARVGLADRLDTYPDKLSGGEQQRVAIARALAHDPLLILADEPTGNLDEDTGDTVLALLLELARGAGKTLFMATHARGGASGRSRPPPGTRPTGQRPRLAPRPRANLPISQSLKLIQHYVHHPLNPPNHPPGLASRQTPPVAESLLRRRRGHRRGHDRRHRPGQRVGRARLQPGSGDSGGPGHPSDRRRPHRTGRGRLHAAAARWATVPARPSWRATWSRRSWTGQPMRLLGVDPFAESPFRSYLGSDDAEAIQPDFLTDMLTRPNSVLLSTDVATRYGLNTGDTLTVRVGGRTQALEIIGLMEPSNDLSRRALDSLLITDIATAQGAGQGGPAGPHRPDPAAG